jgi:hypothetical protein
MTITWRKSKPSCYTWCFFEACQQRLQKSLIDLDVIDANIRGGILRGVMGELSCSDGVAIVNVDAMKRLRKPRFFSGVILARSRKSTVERPAEINYKEG